MNTDRTQIYGGMSLVGRLFWARTSPLQAKAVSPLRSATAVQIRERLAGRWEKSGCRGATLSRLMGQIQFYPVRPSSAWFDRFFMIGELAKGGGRRGNFNFELAARGCYAAVMAKKSGADPKAKNGINDVIGLAL